MTPTKPAISYWSIAALGLFWNLMGCLNYITQTSPDAVAAMPESYQALILTRPAWATVAFAIAVFGGAVGCILLLLRKKVAVKVFILSLAATVLTLVQAIVAVGLSLDVMMATGASLIVAAVLLWVAFAANGKGWLQ